jgi:hypothetical protein
MTDKKYDDTNRGALFKAKKEKEKDRDYSGQLNVAGKDYWLSAWINTDRNGKIYMSLSVKPKDGAPEQKPQTTTTRPKDGGGFETMDDEIPF